MGDEATTSREPTTQDPSRRWLLGSFAAGFGVGNASADEAQEKIQHTLIVEHRAGSLAAVSERALKESDRFSQVFPGERNPVTLSPEQSTPKVLVEARADVTIGQASPYEEIKTWFQPHSSAPPRGEPMKVSSLDLVEVPTENQASLSEILLPPGVNDLGFPVTVEEGRNFFVATKGKASCHFTFEPTPIEDQFILRIQRDPQQQDGEMSVYLAITSPQPSQPAGPPTYLT